MCYVMAANMLICSRNCDTQFVISGRIVRWVLIGRMVTWVLIRKIVK